MGILKRLFGARTSKEAAEKVPTGREDFYRFIAREGAWLLTKGITADGQATFIDYTDEQGRHVWPVFSTQDTAANWVAKSGVRQVTSFPCMQLTARGLVDSLPENAHVVFDLKSPYERIATEEDVVFLKSLVSTGPVP